MPNLPVLFPTSPYINSLSWSSAKEETSQNTPFICCTYSKLAVSLQILRTHYCKDSVGLWKFFRSQGPMKACDLPSWWMYSVQTLTNASSPCPLQKVRHFNVFLSQQCPSGKFKNCSIQALLLTSRLP